MWFSQVGESDGTTDGPVLGIELGTADGHADDGTVFGMVLSADYGTSDGAMIGNATVVLLLVSAASAASADGADGAASAASAASVTSADGADGAASADGADGHSLVGGSFCATYEVDGKNISQFGGQKYRKRKLNANTCIVFCPFCTQNTFKIM